MKRAQLESELAKAERTAFELRAQLASRLGAAFDAAPKTGRDPFMGSGVILQISAIGGAVVLPPVMIRDGLSPETIKALQDD